MKLTMLEYLEGPYMKLLYTLMKFFRSMNQKKVNVSSEGSQEQRAQAKVISAATTKLPKLVLKKFNGQLTAWRQFYDAFDSSVHKNPSLSDVDRFNYLRN